MPHPLVGLSGRLPTHFLAALGVLGAVPDARLHFAGPSLTPHLDSDLSAQTLAEAISDHLTSLLREQLPQLLKGITTTTPSRTRAGILARDSWSNPAADALSTLYSQASGEYDAKNHTQKVTSSDLTLISGKSYTSNSLAKIEYSKEDLRKDIDALFAGGDLQQMSSGQGLRFSITVQAPRLTTGAEEMEILPAVEHLALAGQLLLSPQQRPLPPYAGEPRPRGKAFTWVCNPVPLALGPILDLHDSPPTSLTWPRLTAPITQAPGTAKYSLFQPTREGR